MTMLLPARQFVVCGGLLALMAGGLLLWPDFELVLAGAWAATLIPAGIDAAWLLRNRRRFTASLEVPPTCIRGEVIAARLSVENGTRSRVRLRVRPVLPEQGDPPAQEFSDILNPGGCRTFWLRVKAPVRGKYRFGDVYLRVPGPMGFLQAQFALSASHECRVLPDVRRVKDYLVSRRMRSLLAPHVQTARIRGIGSEFESLREYEEGDDIRRIDWKATARHGTPITRNHEIEHFRNVLIVIDRGRLMGGRVGDGTKLDKAIDCALMVAGVALDSGDRCGLMVFDQDVVAYRPPRAGMAQLQAFVDALYDLQPTLIESHFRRAFIYLQTRLSKRSLVLVLTDVADADASSAVVGGLVALGRRHLVLLAALRTPEIGTVLDEPLDDALAPYRKAVAYRLIRERADVMTRLERGGVHVLDVAPDRLTVPVVNKYIELREANLL